MSPRQSNAAHFVGIGRGIFESHSSFAVQLRGEQNAARHGRCWKSGSRGRLMGRAPRDSQRQQSSPRSAAARRCRFHQRRWVARKKLRAGRPPDRRGAGERRAWSECRGRGNSGNARPGRFRYHRSAIFFQCARTLRKNLNPPVKLRPPVEHWRRRWLGRSWCRFLRRKRNCRAGSPKQGLRARSDEGKNRFEIGALGFRFSLYRGRGGKRVGIVWPGRIGSASRRIAACRKTQRWQPKPWH